MIRQCVANGTRELGAVHIRPKPRGVDVCKPTDKLSFSIYWAFFDSLS